MIIGAFSGGLGGALLFLAISGGLTGLYVLATGRRSWAWLPAKRKAGAVALVVSFALLIAGGLALPRTATADLEAASSEGSCLASHLHSERQCQSHADAVVRSNRPGDGRSAGS